ncbi:DNA gyrase inhibitor YacG [Neisseriaceae bacterium B1]
MTTVKCPTCGTPVQWLPENAYRPFCSQRCKLIDLGEWADEKHAIVAQPETPEEWDELIYQTQQHHD